MRLRRPALQPASQWASLARASLFHTSVEHDGGGVRAGAEGRAVFCCPCPAVHQAMAPGLSVLVCKVVMETEAPPRSSCEKLRQSVRCPNSPCGGHRAGPPEYTTCSRRGTGGIGVMLLAPVCSGPASPLRETEHTGHPQQTDCPNPGTCTGQGMSAQIKPPR